jgi:flagellar M-ring protein FliF
MDALRRTLLQYRDLFRSLSPSQRGTLVAVPLMVGVALAFLLWNGRSSSYVALSWGKTFTTEELMSAEQTLIEAGLNDFRREGRRLLVPRNEVDRFNAALLEGGTLPQGWGDELEKQLVNNASPFRTQQQSEAGRDVALARTLERMIQAVPDVERASVIWARSNAGRRTFGRDPRVTATVTVKPRKGREISTRLVQSLRAAVAGMIPDLNSADVTVFDSSTGLAHSPESEEDAFDSRVLTRIRQFERDYQTKIGEALSHIPDVLVTVHVDIDNLKTSITQERSVDPKKTVTIQESTRRDDEKFTQQPLRAEPGAVPNVGRNLQVAGGPQQQRTSTVDTTSSVNVPWVQLRQEAIIGAMPKAVQVSVKIPEDYYEAVAVKQGLTRGGTDAEKAAFKKAVDEIRTREEANARQTATVLIPASSPPTAVNVSSYVAVEPVEEPIPVSTIDTVSRIAAEWWSAAALAAFALFALWMLKKTMPRLPDAAPAAVNPDLFRPGPAATAVASEESLEQNDRPREPTRRDKVQTIVRDNPEMTATLLSRWIEAAR